MRLGYSTCKNVICSILRFRGEVGALASSMEPAPWLPSIRFRLATPFMRPPLWRDETTPGRRHVVEAQPRLGSGVIGEPARIRARDL